MTMSVLFRVRVVILSLLLLLTWQNKQLLFESLKFYETNYGIDINLERLYNKSNVILQQNNSVVSSYDNSVIKEEGVIITSYFYFKTDPRKQKLPQRPGFEEIYHLYWSAIHQGLHVIIFCDEFSFDDDLILKWQRPPNITFMKLRSQPFWQESNAIDLRFDLYNDHLPQLRHKYKWFLICDLDMIFNRNPFSQLDYYEETKNKTFFGSFDGGRGWKNGAYRVQAISCIGLEIKGNYTEEQLFTPQGCAGLWAGTYVHVKCILNCMAKLHSESPIKDHLQNNTDGMPCDMFLHDHCVFFGGCFSNQIEGQYGRVGRSSSEVLWGKETLGTNQTLFGPTIYAVLDDKDACIKDSWAISHLRCGRKFQKSPICYNHSSILGNTTSGKLVKYIQTGYAPKRGKNCNLDEVTNLPLPNRVCPRGIC